MAISTSLDEALLLLKRWKELNSDVGAMFFSLPRLVLRIHHARVEEVDRDFLRVCGENLEIGIRLGLPNIEFSYLEEQELAAVDPAGIAPKFDECLRLSLPHGLVIVLMGLLDKSTFQRR